MSARPSGRTFPVRESGDRARVDREARLVAAAEHHLADGIDLQSWWLRASRGERPLVRFALDAPGRAFGFFGSAVVGGREMPVMGNYQELDFDLPKAPPGDRPAAAEWLRAQVREFALRYFLRVSGQGETAPEGSEDGSGGVPGGVGRGGFAYRQLLYERLSTDGERAEPGNADGSAGGGQLVRTPGEAGRAFVDLRRLGRDIRWVLAHLRIREFGFEVRPFGALGPRLGMPFRGRSHLVLGAPLVVDITRPSPDQLGCYGLGYAFARDPEPGLLAYGPGELDAAVELIRFHVLASGLVRVVMVFVSNRPQRILDNRFAPFEWGSRMMNMASLGLGDHLRRRLNRALQKEFLERHCVQHHEALSGLLPTWRRVADWLDPASLPSWIPVDAEPWPEDAP